MDFIYLRDSEDLFSLALQENSIKDFIHLNGYKANIKVDKTPITTPLEKREDFKNFIHSLKEKSRVFIYDLRSLSPKISELIQILNCFFEHNLILIVTKYGITISKDSKAQIVVSLLNIIKEENQTSTKTGRPKGSISKSKYDRYKEDIIKMIKEGKSVSEIAKNLGFSRSSIRDYITSRNLRQLVSNQKAFVKELPKSNCKITMKG
jgi:DNA invertase Pin-like site-specific DNA recombinase